MNNPAEPGRSDPLLDAVLRDESWENASAALKTEVLRTFRTRQRIRRLTRWAASAVVIVAAVAGSVHWLSRPAATPHVVAAKPAEVRKGQPKRQYMTDQELLAAFPKGSCFLAEVDGKKMLVFLDPNAQRTYVADEGEMR